MQPTSQCYTSLPAACCLCPGCRPTLFCLNLFPDSLSLLTQSADKTAALQVFDQMRAQKMQPTSQCYTSLLAACARAGDLAAARRVFDSMHVTPTVEAYTALIDACLKQNRSEVNTSAAFEVRPTAVLAACMSPLLLRLTQPS